MRVLRDERHIDVRSSMGQYVTLAGLLTLLIGLVISFLKPNWLVPLMICLTLGFLLSVVGGYLADRYAGPFAHHEALVEMLKGLDYHHVLLQYLLPASHVLLEPGGCTVFVVKSQAGKVSYKSENGKGKGALRLLSASGWKHLQRGKFFRQLVGQEAIGAPHVEAEREKRKLKEYLDERLPDADEVPVRAAVIFVNPDVDLDVEEAPVPIFYRKKVKGWLRGPGDLKPLPPDLRQRLAEALGVEDEA